MPSQPQLSDIAAEAQQWIGTPFAHSASLRGVGADCLGLVLGVLRECGRNFSAPGYQLVPSEHNEAQLIGALQENCDKVLEPQPGHILLFRWRRLATHLGICTENGFVHAYFPAGRVVEVPLYPVWAGKIHSAWELK